MSVELLPIFFRKPITRNTPEAVVQRCSVKKVFLQFSQNSQENTYGRISFLIKLQASSKFQANFIKKPTSAEFIEHLWLLFLTLIICSVKVLCIWDENTFIENFHTNYSFFNCIWRSICFKLGSISITYFRNRYSITYQITY